MNATLLALITGHLIADFWLQPASWIDCKRQNGWKSKRLILHAVIASILPVVCTLQANLWWFVPVIFIAHYLTDFLKTKTTDNLLAFIVDQIIHIGLLYGLSEIVDQPEASASMKQFWTYSISFVFITTPAGILIGKFLQSITKAENKPLKTDASAWIGMIERILILIFILSMQFQAIGFLVAAKSIFRFSEIQKEGNPKAEYFLLGTLTSFLVAVVAGMTIKFTIGS